MAYCTQTDVEVSAGGSARLVEMADWDCDGVADAERIASEIEKVDSWVNSYIGKARSVPLASPVPSIIRWTCTDEVVYRLKVDRGMVTDDDKEQHRERLTWLEGVAAGQISLGVEPAPAAASTNAAAYGERSSSDGADIRSDYEGFV